MITLHFRPLPQYKYELFHIYFTKSDYKEICESHYLKSKFESGLEQFQTDAVIVPDRDPRNAFGLVVTCERKFCEQRKRFFSSKGQTVSAGKEISNVSLPSLTGGHHGFNSPSWLRIVL